MKSGRDVLEISFQPFLEAQKSISTEGLHKSLCRRFPNRYNVVRGLQISMHETAPFSYKPLCQGKKLFLEFLLKRRLKFDPADIPDKMIPEIIRFQSLETSTKALHEPHTL